MTSQRMGEVCFPVASVLPKLRMEDRDVDGMIYTTQIVPFDAVEGGKNVGRIYLSFETKTPPPRKSGKGGCCIFENAAYARGGDDDADLDSTCRSSAYRATGSDGVPGSHVSYFSA